MAKIGVQMMMLKEIVYKDGIYDVFKRLSDMGIKCVEVSQIPMTPKTIKEMKRACDDFGIEIAALSALLDPIHPGMASLNDSYDKIVDHCKTLNCNYLRMGMLPFEYIGSLEKSMEFAHKIEEMATRLEKDGIKLYYHNHHVEFVKYDGKYLLDIIKDNTRKIGFEIDVHWVQRGGANPTEFIEKYAGRLDLLHLKDYKIVEPNFEGIDHGDLAKFMSAFTDVVHFAEVGEGSLNFKDIIPAGLKAGAQYLLIEQDMMYGKDPFDCIKTSVDNLTKLGYGDLL